VLQKIKQQGLWRQHIFVKYPRNSTEFLRTYLPRITFTLK